jgi:hypothetical protein
MQVEMKSYYWLKMLLSSMFFIVLVDSPTTSLPVNMQQYTDKLIHSTQDIGAEELHISTAPPAVSDLGISGHLIPDAFHATLTWTPPADAVTTTIRFTYTHITERNWPSAYLLIAYLPGEIDSYIADIAYDIDPFYVALKTQDFDGDWSALSNVVYWPRQLVCLPLLLYQP